MYPRASGAYLHDRHPRGVGTRTRAADVEGFRGHGVGGRQRVTSVLSLLAAAAFLLSGCENADRFLEVTFVNHTDTDLTIYVSVDPRASVPAGETVTADIDGRGCSSHVTAMTEDGRFIAEPPGELCLRDTWTIEQSDLGPAPAPSAGPSPGPSP